MIHYVESTTSSNDDARDPRYGEGDVVWAEFQTAGRGQRGHVWKSAAGCNVTFSLVLKPTFLVAREQFAISEIVPLALAEMFAGYGIDARIKWTNDVYVGDRKIVGMLIEHDLSGGMMSRTIAGIGINVNQREFDPALPNPTSMLLETGREFDRREVLERFYDRVMSLYGELRRGGGESIRRRYVEKMYRLGERHTYAWPDGTRFEGVIRGVGDAGELLVEHDDGTVRGYLFKEIEFVIKK